MGKQLDSLNKSIDNYKRIVEAARNAIPKKEVSQENPRSSETGTPSPTGQQPPNEPSAPSVS